MTTPKSLLAITLAAAFTIVPGLGAQVQTIVFPVIPGAKPVTVQNIKIHAVLQQEPVPLPVLQITSGGVLAFVNTSNDIPVCEKAGER